MLIIHRMENPFEQF